MSEEHKKYVPEGVFLVCDKGGMPSQLVANKRNVKVYGLTQVTAQDNVFGKNILPFGSCTTLQGPCAFSRVLWSKEKKGNYYINGEKPLLEHSEASCSVGGGSIKLYFDQYDAEKAGKKNQEQSSDSAAISSVLLDVFLTGNLATIWKLTSSDCRTVERANCGGKKGIEGAENYLMEDMWKTEVWKFTQDNHLVVGVSCALSSATPGVDTSDFFLGWLDVSCNANLTKNKVALEAGLERAVHKTIDNYKQEYLETDVKTAVLVNYAVVEITRGPQARGEVSQAFKHSAEALVGQERIAQVSANVSKFVRAVRGGMLRVVRVGGKVIAFFYPLTQEVLDEAIRVVKTTSANNRGPCLSGLYDPASKKTFYGLNFKKNATGKADYYKWIEAPSIEGGADDIIKQLVKGYDEKIKRGEIVLSEVTDRKYAAHSELRALDQAIKARREAGIPVDHNAIKEMSLSNRDLQPKVIERNNNTPPLKARCQNCEYLTNGVQLNGHN